MTPVLVADDSESIRRLVQAMLAGDAYEVREAADGAEALEALRASEQPMVVLLDYRMPRLDGFGVLHAAVENGRLLTQNEYIIITSEAGTFPEDFIDLLRRLSIRVLPKPFDQDALVSAVALAVERLNAPVEQALPDLPTERQQDAT
jgi:two-component system chemotaxis response regulator CheY